MKNDTFPFGLLVLGALLFAAWLTQRQKVNAPDGSKTPNANNNSERQRDIQQSRNSGYAEVPTFVYAESQRRLDELLNPGSWPKPDWAKD